MRPLRLVLLAAVTAVFAGALAGSVGASSPDPSALLAAKRSVVPGHAARPAAASQQSPAIKSQFECMATSGGVNTRLDCDDPFPNNEPHLVVDSADPLHMIGSSNDYGSCCDEF